MNTTTTKDTKVTKVTMLTVVVATIACVTMTAVAARAQTGSGPDIDPRIEKLVATISQERLERLLTVLVSFGTRNTMSDTTSTTRGIGAARQWILDELT